MWLRRKIGHMIVSKTRVVFEPFNMKILVTAKPSRLENSTRAESFRVKKRITLFPVFRMSKQTKVRKSELNESIPPKKKNKKQVEGSLEGQDSKVQETSNAVIKSSKSSKETPMSSDESSKESIVKKKKSETQKEKKVQKEMEESSKTVNKAPETLQDLSSEEDLPQIAPKKRRKHIIVSSDEESNNEFDTKKIKFDNKEKNQMGETSEIDEDKVIKEEHETDDLKSKSPDQSDTGKKSMIKSSKNKKGVRTKSKDAETKKEETKSLKKRKLQDRREREGEKEIGEEESRTGVKAKRGKTEKIKKLEPKAKEDEEIESEKEESELEEKEKKAIKVSTSKLVDQKDMKDVGADWKKDEPVPYAGLCKTFEAIESTTKRLEIQEYLTSFFKHVIELSPENLLETLYLCLNRVCPEYENVELGIGESLLIKAIAEVTGRTAQKVKNELAEVGDLGKVAKDSKNSQKSISSMFGNNVKPLTVSKVFNSMKKIASLTGNNSQDLKVKEIQNLLKSCRDEEPKFLIRSLEGKLRIGLAEQTVLICLAQAFVVTDKEYKKLTKAKKAEELTEAPKIIKSIYSELPSYDTIVPALLKGGLRNLKEHCKLTPGIPLKPMLAHPTKSITEVLNRVEGHMFTCEFKYDGERGQIHRLEDGSIKIYSRNLEDNTVKYPDVIEKVSEAAKSNINSYVLDCEVVAWDLEKHSLLPFQVLSTRKRKDVKEAEIKVSVCLFAFDLLYLNGESLLKKSLEERRKLMYDSFQKVEDKFSFVQNINATNTEEIQAFLDESVKANCEGLMVKILDGLESSYEPSKRSRNWLKLKKDYLSGVGDSLDLVVVGAFYGRGKRTKVYGAFLLACYDPENEEYQTICKIGTGFSDSDLETHFNYLKEKEMSEPRSYFNYDKTTKPDVWFEPCQVWEVKAADLSISPIYKAAVGQVDTSKGVSLRFPRFIQIRDDKKPEDATTSEQVAELFRKQYNNNDDIN